VGAAYLAYLGLRILLTKQETLASARVARQPLGKVFRQGVITNVLNPKVALFFLAFLPQFASPSRGSIGWQIVLLGLIFDTSGTLVNMGVALTSGYFGDRLRGRPVFARVQRWFTGGVFLALATRLALPERR
jgi:threonine/homoserine/homoserine lactone efflux protein